jgi:SAM-dependent methyltransferase
VTGNSPTQVRGSFQGALQILRFNWPWYLLALALSAAVVSYLVIAGPGWKISLTLLVIAGFADFWLVSSLLVSHLIYDRSEIASGSWMEQALPTGPLSIANFHAGLDEASHHLSRQFPAARLSVFDFHDSTAMSEPAIERARRRPGAASESIPIPFAKIPLDDSALDTAFVVFAAHELRRPEDRLSFFKGLRRVLRPGGDLIVVEHLRDAWNILAFGPGAFHFLPMSQWLGAFVGAGFTIQQELHVTPFVTVFRLRGASVPPPVR